MKSWWRATVFLLIALLGIALGTYWHRGAATGAGEDVIRRPVPLTLGVYTDHPGLTLTMAVTVRKRPKFVEADVSVIVPLGSILFTANRMDRDRSLYTITGQPIIGNRTVTGPYAAPTVEYVTPTTVLMGSFTIPSDSYFDSGGIISIRLPVVGAEEEWSVNDESELHLPAFGTSLVQNPEPIFPTPMPFDFGTYHSQLDTDARNYHQPGDSKHKPINLYWAPGKINTQVTVVGLGKKLLSADTRVNAPSNGAVVNNGNDYRWTGVAPLAPIVSAIDRHVGARRSNDSFYSGLAFATAAAAVVALMQEGPERWRDTTWLRRRRRRKIEHEVASVATARGITTSQARAIVQAQRYGRP